MVCRDGSSRRHAIPYNTYTRVGLCIHVGWEGYRCSRRFYVPTDEDVGRRQRQVVHLRNEVIQ